MNFDPVRRRSLGLLFALPLVAAARRGAAQAARVVPIIDAHAHPTRSSRNLNDGVRTALALMDQLGAKMTILSPPPFPESERGMYGNSDLRDVARAHAGRFAFTAGGESLNPMIQQIAPDRITPDILSRFQREAEGIAQSGAAGFGEIAAEHFSNRMGRHPYESSPPDHPLILALADISAKYGMPIELHMEAVPQDMPFPPARSGPPNPATLKENISAFERLLDHNSKARIVWLHAGWDLSGERTVKLMRSLLERHANLFMSVKSDHSGVRLNAPFLPDGTVKPAWVAMLRAFPDRFIIGSDQFFDEAPERLERARKLVDGLPADLAPLVASGNVSRIYRLAA